MSSALLEKLSGPLEAGPEPGLETVDPRFTEVTDLADAEDFAAASERVEALVDAGVYDIRLIVFYLFDVFQREGVARIEALFTTLDNLVGDNQEAIGPARRRQQHIARSVSWLCQTMTDRIEYGESKQSADWVKWQSLDPAVLAGAASAVEALARRLDEPAYGESAQVVGHLLRWLRDIREATESERASQAPQKPAVTSPDDATQEAPHVSHAPVTPAGDPDPQMITLQCTAELRTLLEKLQAFEKLVEAGRFDKAALVSDDVITILDHFDPRDYFPGLFARFGRLMSEHVGQLEARWAERDTTAWNAMKQFYKVDLSGFVGSE